MTGRKADDSYTSPVRRVDAERNRARILDAARSALLESEDVSMHAIAKRAGIGQGTLYRNFPNREALILAVHRHGIQELVDATPVLAEAHSPTDGLRRWLRDLARHSRGKCGLAGALLSSTYQTLCSEDYQPIVDALEILLQACRNAGEIRSDVDARDLLLLVSFLWYVEPDNEGRGRSDRLLDIVIDALRVDREERAGT